MVTAAEATGFLLVFRWFVGHRPFPMARYCHKSGRRPWTNPAARWGQARAAPQIPPRDLSLPSRLPPSSQHKHRMNFPGGAAHRAQEPCPVTRPQGHLPAGSPAREPGKGRRLAPRALPGLTPAAASTVRASKTTGSNAQLVTTENSGRGQTQCRTQDRIQVLRQPAGRAPPRSQYPSHRRSLRWDPGTFALHHPSRLLQEGGHGRTPGPRPLHQRHTSVPARTHSDRLRGRCVSLTVKLRGEGAASHRY